MQTLTPDLAEQFDAKPGEGVGVTEVKRGSIAASAGIEPGTVILQANRKPLQDASAFERAIQQSPDKRVLLLIRRGGMQQFLILQW